MGNIFTYARNKINKKYENNNALSKVFIWLIIVALSFELYVFLLTMNDMPLNNVIINISKDFFFWFIILGIIFIFGLLRKCVIKIKLFYVVWILAFLLSLPQMPVLFGYETTQIGDFYEAKEYTEEYYVIMSRQPQDKESRKAYTLSAEIERSLDYLCETDGHEVYELNYHINQLYFTNGGYLVFDEPNYSIVQVGHESEVTDYHNNTYYITLTKEKVNN